MISIHIPSIILPSPRSIQAIILAAGQGSRLKTGITKMITPICGNAMVLYPIHLMHQFSFPITVVIGYQKEVVRAAIEKEFKHTISFAEQAKQLGTGHALMATKDNWQADHVLVINGDMPLLSKEMIQELIKEHFKHNAAISIVTSYNIDPTNNFGRIVHQDKIIKVVEKKHFTYDIKDYPYVNAGIYLIKRSFLQAYNNHLKQHATTQEFYITDLVEIASSNNLPVVTLPWNFDTLYGVNTFQELAHVEKIHRNILINYWMDQGVRCINPDTIHIDQNVTIGRGTIINAGAQLIANTHVGEFVTIGAHTVLGNAIIGDRVKIGANSVIENKKIDDNEIIAPCSYIHN